MRLINITILLSIILLKNITYAETHIGNFTAESKEYENLTIVGDVSLKDVKLKELSVTGRLSFNNLSCSGEVLVAGHIDNSTKAKFKSLIVTGPVNLSDSDIEKVLIIGMTDLKNLKAKTINITGHLEMDNAIISEDSLIVGVMLAKNSKFSDISIATDKSTLDSSIANNIKILKDPTNPKKVQKLILKNNTQILGDVEFESGNGELVKDDTVKITGKIIGIKSKKCNCSHH
jgi:hypothetical protein